MGPLVWPQDAVSQPGLTWGLGLQLDQVCLQADSHSSGAEKAG